MTKKKLKRKIRKLKKKIKWYHDRLVSDIITNNMKEMGKW